MAMPPRHPPVRRAATKYIDPATSPRQGLTSFERRVLDVVDSIPPGYVMAYSDIAEFLGEGTARSVARVMSTKTEPDTPWQRVLKADGRCAPEVAVEQLVLLRAENTPFALARSKIVSDRVDLAKARWLPLYNPVVVVPTTRGTGTRIGPAGMASSPDESGSGSG
jgi:alkylated DNA nucleotide flippase Atl1